jgi:ribosomal protein S27E
MSRWVCDYCGNTGTVPRGQTSDQVQCPDCGEPVQPLPPGNDDR